jgi:phage portal protein BeeE
MFDFLRKFFEKKESAVTQAIIQTGWGVPQWTPLDYYRLAEDGYQKSSDGYACIQQIITAAKNVAWYPMTMDGNGNEVVSDNARISQLIKRPNPRQSWTQLVEETLGFMNISGNFYLEGVWKLGPNGNPVRGQGLPLEIYSHRPDRMRVVPAGGSASDSGSPSTQAPITRRVALASSKDGNPVGAYQYVVNGRIIVFSDPTVICHGRLFNPINDWYGQSPLQACRYSLEAGTEARAYQQASLKNGVRLSGAFIGPDDADLTQEQVDAIKAKIQQQYMGPNNAGGFMVVGGGWKWVEMSQTSADAQLLDTRLADKRDVAAALGVPSILVGDTAASTYSNWQQARKALYQDTVLPQLTIVKDETNRWLDLDLNVEFFGFDVSQIDVLQEGASAQMERLVMGVKNAIIKPNEAAIEIGYEREPGEGDDLIAPAQSVLLETLADPDENPQPQPQPAPTPIPAPPPPANAATNTTTTTPTNERAA